MSVINIDTLHEQLKNIQIQPEILQVLESLAKQGDSEMMYILGWCYLKGKYLPQDLDHSFYWLELAVNANHEKAKELIEYCKFLKTLN